MGDEQHTAGGPRLGPALFGAVISAGGATAMAVAATVLEGASRTAHGEDRLIALVLVALALLGTALCLYLAVIWGLAAAILLTGPAGRTGRMLLGVLRVMAPRLARRLSVGAAVATATTGLVLGPALAVEGPAHPDLHDAEPVASQVLEELPLELPAETGDHSAAENSGPGPADDPAADADDSSPRPPLGWGDPTPAEALEEDSDDTAAPGSGGTDSTATESAPPRTVVVQAGDSLWTLTDDLLGPLPDDPAVIAASWPALYEANADVIGPDADLLVPGQVLTVPAALEGQETS